MTTSVPKLLSYVWVVDKGLRSEEVDLKPNETCEPPMSNKVLRSRVKMLFYEDCKATDSNHTIVVYITKNWDFQHQIFNTKRVAFKHQKVFLKCRKWNKSFWKLTLGVNMSCRSVWRVFTKWKKSQTYYDSSQNNDQTARHEELKLKIE